MTESVNPIVPMKSADAVALSQTPKPDVTAVKEQPYEKRIAKMTDRQLVGEIRKQKKTLTEKHIQFKLLSVLEVLMASHKRGLTPYLRG